MVDMAVKRLRQRVEDDGGRPRLIVTVHGLGYRCLGSDLADWWKHREAAQGYVTNRCTTSPAVSSAP
jgi:hypothetical protein